MAWSDLKDNITQLQEATLPYPIVVALESEADQPKNGMMATNSIIFEFTLSEFGSWRFTGQVDAIDQIADSASNLNTSFCLTIQFSAGWVHSDEVPRYTT